MDIKQKRRPGKPASRDRTAAAAPGKYSAKTQSRHGSAPSQRTKAPQEPPVKPSTDVVYMAPKPFSRNRMLLRLTTVAAVVLALVLGVSVFFKVENVVVSGTQKYTPWDIRSASGIEVGENLLTFSRAKASGKIIGALPYVGSVRIGIKLPDTVMIDIVEVEVTYAVKAQDDSWWLLSADGKVIEKPEQEPACTQLRGIRIEMPRIGEAAVAMETPAETDGEGNTLPVTVTAAQRLQLGLDIAEYLERNGVIGKAASIDVSTAGDLQLWYGEQYHVKLGDDTQLSYKISCMKNVIDNMESYAGGVLDITNPDKIQYQPF